MRITSYIFCCLISLCHTVASGSQEPGKPNTKLTSYECCIAGNHPTELTILCRQQIRHSANKDWEKWLMRRCERGNLNDIIQPRYRLQYARNVVGHTLTVRPARYSF